MSVMYVSGMGPRGLGNRMGLEQYKGFLSGYYGARGSNGTGTDTTKAFQDIRATQMSNDERQMYMDELKNQMYGGQTGGLNGSIYGGQSSPDAMAEARRRWYSQMQGGGAYGGSGVSPMSGGSTYSF